MVEKKKKKNTFKETQNHVKSHSECDVLADGSSLLPYLTVFPALSVCLDTGFLSRGLVQLVQAMFDNQGRAGHN